MDKLKCNEKIVDSKIQYMQGTLPVALPTAGKPLRQPLPILPSSSDSEEETEVAVSLWSCRLDPDYVFSAGQCANQSQGVDG